MSNRINLPDSANDNDHEKSVSPSVRRGVHVITSALKTLTGSPGVYRMTDKDGNPLYVGKAKNIKKRVTAYTRPFRLPVRLQRMIAATAKLEVIKTHTEVEALLLESNLIKQLKPRYNVLLRDDKSFPFILITSESKWPQLVKHRGSRSEPGEYFGPFASAGAVNRTLASLQRAFPLRNCSDNIFQGRTRPCLQYQIKRCTAPCVGRIEQNDYSSIVDEARKFLTGHNRNMQETLSSKMQEASDNLDYESAALYRDRIKALTQIQAHQDVNIAKLGDADVVAVTEGGGGACVQVFFYRAGQNFGNRTYFPIRVGGASTEEILAAFLGQFYHDKQPPGLVLVSENLTDKDLIEEGLKVRANRKVELTRPKRGIKKNLIVHALNNAREALARRVSESASQHKLLDAVADTFDLEGPPRRIEVYDNSHISGSKAVGAMIVAGPDGFAKTAYRRFNIKNQELTPGDDYGMMKEVIARRFNRALQEDPDRQSGYWPDLLLIDGGIGQLSSVKAVLADLAVDDIPVVAISKGRDRDAGREKFHITGRNSFMMKPNDPVLYYLQRLRDEAHRFALGGHHTRRRQSITQSPLDQIPGVGSIRKKALLHHFGSSRAVGEAGLVDLELVSGISRPLAKKIYDHFHSDG